MLLKHIRRMFSSSSPLKQIAAMPEHVKKVEDEEDPSVHDMILYFFHKAIGILEPEMHKIVEEEKIMLSDERKKFRVEGIVRLISNFSFAAEISFPIKKDCGGYEIITGYRVHHCMHRIPMVGGILLHPCVTLEDVMGVSALNTFKCAMLNIPFGGSQGAIQIHPADFTDNDRQKISRRYIVELLKKNIIGPGIDCGSNDMNTGRQEMSWMTDAYMKTFGSTDINAMAIMSGKPSFGGGISGKFSAAGWGIFSFMDYLLKNNHLMDKINMKPCWEGKTFIVEGFGNVGYNAAVFLQKAGAKLIGVIEHDGSIFDENGLDAKDLGKYKFSHNGLKGYSQGKPLHADEVRSSKCDFLLLCAWHKSIKKSNAKEIQAKVIVEGADAPTTPAAEKILSEKKILIIPDICAGGGGVASSYFEWLKNIRHLTFGRMIAGQLNVGLPLMLEAMNESLKKSVGEQANLMPPEDVRQNLISPPEKDIIRTNIAKSLQDAACLLLKKAGDYDLDVNLRMAAYCISILKVFKSYEAGGLAV